MISYKIKPNGGNSDSIFALIFDISGPNNINFFLRIGIRFNVKRVVLENAYKRISFGPVLFFQILYLALIAALSLLVNLKVREGYL